MKIRRFATSMSLVLAIASLAACQQGKDPAAEATAGADAAAPDAKPGLSVSDGVLILPAVKGNPGAVYFAVTNGSEEATTLAAVSIDGVGRTEMHETRGGTMEPVSWVQLEAGKTVRFERGGRHVMAFGIADTIEPGSAPEMTLTFSGGDKLSTPLRVETVGGTTENADHGGHN